MFYGRQQQCNQQISAQMSTNLKNVTARTPLDEHVTLQRIVNVATIKCDGTLLNHQLSLTKRTLIL